MTKIDLNLKRLVFKSCLLAAWTDGNMSSGEYRYLSHLTTLLSETEEEREALRKLRFEHHNEDRVLAEIALQGKTERTYIFDTCLAVLTSDRMLNRQELAFLDTLRKTCGLRSRPYKKKLKKARKASGAGVERSRAVGMLGFLASVLLGASLIAYGSLRRVDITAEENSNGKEVLISIFEPDSGERAELQTGEEIFEHLRQSILTVTVSISNRPVCSGSGSVIGKDETGIVYVLTNRHVIHNDLTETGKPGDFISIEVQQHSEARFDAVLDFYSREHDIALLAVKGMEPYVEPLTLVLKQSLQVGQTVYVAGTPVGLKHTFTSGIISALRESYLQTDATIHSGSSGGPVVDQSGALCAVITRGHEAKDYALALYTDTVLEVLEERTRHLNQETKKTEAEEPESP